MEHQGARRADCRPTDCEDADTDPDAVHKPHEMARSRSRSLADSFAHSSPDYGHGDYPSSSDESDEVSPRGRGIACNPVDAMAMMTTSAALQPTPIAHNGWRLRRSRSAPRPPSLVALVWLGCRWASLLIAVRSLAWVPASHTGGLTLYEQNRAPLAKVTDDSTTTLMIRTLNQELTCAVCLGVIHNTRTVMECLHRFCANCISKSLRLGYESRSRAVPRVRSRVWESARRSRRVR